MCLKLCCGGSHEGLPMNRSKRQSPNRRMFTVYGSCFFNRGTPIYTPTTIVLVVGTPEKRTLVLGNPKIGISKRVEVIGLGFRVVSRMLVVYGLGYLDPTSIRERSSIAHCMVASTKLIRRTQCLTTKIHLSRLGPWGVHMEPLMRPKT